MEHVTKTNGLRHVGGFADICGESDSRHLPTGHRQEPVRVIP